VIGLGRSDEDRVDVDADDVVADACEVAAESAGSAAGVEDAGVARGDGVDEACFAVEVVAVGGHGAKSFDVPVRVFRVSFGQFDPPVLRHRRNANDGPCRSVRVRQRKVFGPC